MTNADIRKKALAKVKVKNLTFLAVLSYALHFFAQFARGVTGAALPDALIVAGAGLVLSLAVPAGLVRASMTAWRQNEAKFGTYFGSFFRPRLLPRGLALGAAGAAVEFGAYFLLLGVLGGRVSLWLAVPVIALLVPAGFAWLFLYFALELQPDAHLLPALRRGIRVILKNLGRILLMELSLLWWVALTYLAALAIALASGLRGAALNAVTSLVALVLTWLIGAYVCLGNAGLAREIFKDWGDGA